MKYAVEAYDALVENLKKEIQKLNNDLDEEKGTSSTIIHRLLDYIHDKNDLKHAIDIASILDKKFPKERLTEYVKDTWAV